MHIPIGINISVACMLVGVDLNMEQNHLFGSHTLYLRMYLEDRQDPIQLPINMQTADYITCIRMYH
jgi:hypothetical protein